MTEGSDPVHKVSIVARGQAGGVTMYLPKDDKTLHSLKYFKTRLIVGLGGRAAEELSFPTVTTGASDDLQRVTKLARAMVTQYGMSKQMGPITYGQKEELVFLGKEIGEQKNYSEDVARTIDLEVRRMVQEAYDAARRILSENKDKLDEVANLLIAEETVDGATFNALFA